MQTSIDDLGGVNDNNNYQIIELLYKVFWIVLPYTLLMEGVYGGQYECEGGNRSVNTGGHALKL